MAFLISSIIAIGVIATAIFSVQNATAVAIQLLVFRSFQMPVGILLAMAAAGGLLSVSLGQLIWRLTAESPMNDYTSTYEADSTEVEDW